MSGFQPVILGAMGLSDRPQGEVDRIIHCAVEHGMTTIDTAPLYGAGRCEEVVGRAIADRRSQVQVLTKCGLRWDGDHGARRFEMLVDGGLHWVRTDSRPRSIVRGVEESLRRLQVEAIDLMQIHQLDVDSPVDAALCELEKARDAGKIREIGISNFPLREAQLAQRQLSAGLFSVQNEFSMVATGHDRQVLAWCHQQGVRFLAYSPLAHGVLAGKYLERPLHQAESDWGGHYTHPANLRKINTVLRQIALPIAVAHQATLSQVCLAWALAQPGVSHVIAGATRESQVLENAAAGSMALARQEISRLTDAIRACGLDLTPGASVRTRVRNQVRRVRRLGSELLRRFGLR
jgi:methylglyoxal reductase